MSFEGEKDVDDELGISAEDFERQLDEHIRLYRANKNATVGLPEEPIVNSSRKDSNQKLTEKKLVQKIEVPGALKVIRDWYISFEGNPDGINAKEFANQLLLKLVGFQSTYRGSDQQILDEINSMRTKLQNYLNNKEN